ncbi:DUF4129 domain-containing protein [Bacillus sp. DJP31]|uniref:DUF4129 domain-containing protein n=1 Tax=Bacillus sp. DJP31 TaxID=3409789 RepID=UPI003BB4CACC
MTFNPDQARDDIKDILDDKEYRIYDNDSRNIFEILWEKSYEWLTEQLAKLFSSFEPTGAMTGTILLVGIVVVMTLLFVILLVVVRNRTRKHPFRDHKPLHSLSEMKWSYQRHLLEARTHEVVEEYNLATRHMFLALLLYFHEKGWLEARVWKTNWEYYDELLKVNQNGADHFYNLALLFDEVTYGERKIQKEEYIQYRNDAKKWLEVSIEQDSSLER